MSDGVDAKFDRPLFTSLPAHNKKIWAVGGGKGGVGKSFVISNLAITLAKQGKRTILVDLDLGGANVHTCLGADIPKQSLTDFFSGRAKTLESLLNKTSLPTLHFISGANDALTAADATPAQHLLLLKQLLVLPCDYLLLDLGAGTHAATLDYFLLATRPLINITPEPTSIENAYRFIKSAYFRWIKAIEARLNLKSVVDQAMDQKNNLGIKTPYDLIKKISTLNPQQGEAFKKELQKFHLYLAMNQVRTRNDVDMGNAVKTVCEKYFGIETHYVGYLDYDNAVWQSVRKRRPLILEHPYSVLVGEFAQIVKSLDENEGHPRTDILRAS